MSWKELYDEAIEGGATEREAEDYADQWATRSGTIPWWTVG